MSFWLTVAGMVAVTFGSRYAGLARRTELPDFWVRFLHFVPIAVFASLVRLGAHPGLIRRAAAPPPAPGRRPKAATRRDRSTKCIGQV